jgi:hypothetical protein
LRATIDYELKYDARSVSAAIASAKGDVVGVFVRAAVNADLDPSELQTIRDRVVAISGVGKQSM